MVRVLGVKKNIKSRKEIDYLFSEIMKEATDLRYKKRFALQKEIVICEHCSSVLEVDLEDWLVSFAGDIFVVNCPECKNNYFKCVGTKELSEKIKKETRYMLPSSLSKKIDLIKEKIDEYIEETDFIKEFTGIESFTYILEEIYKIKEEFK